MNRRGGLGRGLAALIPPGEDQRATLVDLPIDAVVPNPRQPREVFDEDEIEGLAVSIQDMGLLQPIVVRPVDEDRYELIAGERRLRASKRAGLETLPAVVRHTDDADLLKEALVENIHRVQLNPLEEAAAYQQLLEEFGFTQEELAGKLGRSRPAIGNALRLLGLPPGVQRRVAAGVLSAGHAKALLSVPDAAAQQKLADRIVAEGLSVRATEELVRLRFLEDAPEPSSGPKRRSRVSAPGLVELQENLSDALMARVKISVGARKGRLQVEFGSVDDLERIVGVIARGLETDLPEPQLQTEAPEEPDAPEPDAPESGAPVSDLPESATAAPVAREPDAPTPTRSEDLHEASEPTAATASDAEPAEPGDEPGADRVEDLHDATEPDEATPDPEDPHAETEPDIAASDDAPEPVELHATDQELDEAIDALDASDLEGLDLDELEELTRPDRPSY